MSPIQHLRVSDARRLPWKNGRGFTDELALWPAGASLERADFDWRISKASVVEDGPFSLFPGFERVLVVTRGAGLELAHGSASKPFELDPLVPHRFDGGLETRARLLAGAVEDFNVICRRGAASADVEVWTGSVARELSTEPGEEVLAHLLEGELEALEPGGTRWTLAAGESLRVRAAMLPFRLRGSAILVRIRAQGNATPGTQPRG